MSKETLNNGESGLVIRGKINGNFTENYNSIAGAEGDIDTNTQAIADETTRALAVEAENYDAIVSNSGRLTTVENFSELNEEKIEDNEAAISAEVSRATAAELVLQENINEVDDSVTNVDNHLDVAIIGAGLNEDGTYKDHATANYITAATSIDNATTLLDEQLLINLAITI